MTVPRIGRITRFGRYAPVARITREADVTVVTLTNVLGTTPAIPFAAWAGAVLITPAAYVSTTVTVYTAASDSDTFVPLEDSAGAAITFTVAASTATVLPAGVYGCRWLKLVTNGDDTARDVSLCRKG